MKTRDVNYKCKICEKTFTLKLSESGIAKYNSPDYNKIQDCFPELSQWEREIMISNLCKDCFIRVFKEEKI